MNETLPSSSVIWFSILAQVLFLRCFDLPVFANLDIFNLSKYGDTPKLIVISQAIWQCSLFLAVSSNSTQQWSINPADYVDFKSRTTKASVFLSLDFWLNRLIVRSCACIQLPHWWFTLHFSCDTFTYPNFSHSHIWMCRLSVDPVDLHSSVF